jgi:Na+-transporting NADH:ubiquinone oxidoreductase subunit C
MSDDTTNRNSAAWLAPLRAIFELPNDDSRKVVAVAVALCLVCSLIVSAAAVGLRPLQDRNESLALKREILKVAGLYQPGVDIERAFAGLDSRLVDLASGEYVTDIDAAAYDMRKAAVDPKQSLALSNAEDLARIRSRARVMPVYLLRNGEGLSGLVLPVYGYGLWSTMYGLLALESDGRTVADISFYDQRETAGLGGEVANPRWQATWVGKQVLDAQGVPRFRVAKGSVDAGSPDAAYQVDGLSGATLTSNGVTNLVQFWMGDLGYGPYLQRLRAGNGG